MGEKIMYACMCNWVPMLYSGKKKGAGEKKKWHYTFTLPENVRHIIIIYLKKQMPIFEIIFNKFNSIEKKEISGNEKRTEYSIVVEDCS